MTGGGWMRFARRAGVSLLAWVAVHVAAASAEMIPVVVTSLDPRFDHLVPKDVQVERIAEGFSWVEGPVWHKEERALLFSDIPANAVYRWTARDGVSLFLARSGYRGAEPFPGKEPGSNGLAFDQAGRLVLCRHGDREVGRLEPDGRLATVAARYEGHRLNSPNDLVFDSNGNLFFTDPPFGLPGVFQDPGKAPVQGVFRLTPDGRLSRLVSDLVAPNGLALSPDEKTLYVSDVDPRRAAWWAYDVQPDGSVANGRVLFDAARWRRDPFFGPDGFKVDREGHIFGARPGGVSVIAPDGILLGTIETGRPTSNVAWGEDGRTLFLTSGDAVYRMRLTTAGAGY